VSGYLWVYKDTSRDDVAAVLRLADVADVKLSTLWLDVEDTESVPHPMTVDLLASEAERLGQRAGIYTGKWWYDRYWGERVSSDFLAKLPLWVAEYDGIPDLNQWTSFGEWKSLAGKQYAADNN